MWDQLENIPPILVGQSIFTYLDLKNIVKLETALASSERIQTLQSFLAYFSKDDMIVPIPQKMTKLKWLQAHDFPIIKAIVDLDKINTTFETKMICEIELVNKCIIRRTSINYLQDSCYEKVVSVCFGNSQDAEVMEELFSHLNNLRELSVNGRNHGWLQRALRRLYREVNNNVLLERMIICDNCVSEIVFYCPRLQSLSLNFDITEDALLVLSTYCTLLNKVQILNISKMSTEQSAAHCARGLSCIHSIRTSLAMLTADTVFYSIAIPYMTELRDVVFNGVTDHILMPLLSQYCLKLEIVSIHIFSNATPAQLLQLAQNCPYLHTIRIEKDIFYTDSFVVALAARCPNLQKLYLRYVMDTDNLTDASILALSEHCPNLRELECEGFNLITEAAVLQLLHSCKQIYELTLPSNCLSEDTILSLPVTVSEEYGYNVGSRLILTFDI